MTTPDFHQRATRLFLELCESAPGEQTAILARAAAADPKLAEHVQSLLARDGQPSGFLDSPVLGDDFRIPTIAGVAPPDVPLPQTIGLYRVIGLLGRGGMGAVYLAEQESPKRQVALKVIDAELASPDALRRFAFEAEVLARLHHPGIAQIHEAGSATADGHTRVFFAMELVKGRPLTAHAAGAGLELRERLELVATVCDAVQHAHSKGVVHRDLKPANILVDESGRPRVLDFGIARTIGPEPGEQTMHTLAGQVVGTLPYMAPEQVAGDSRDVDTRVDVYAIGVVMYELLAGRQPLDVSGCALVQAARMIAEQEPTPLGELDRHLRGDIEAIAAQALAKDPSRRYQTAADLAADIRRFLSGQPITSRPASAVYQLRKFAARNRVLVLVTAMFGAIALVGAGVAGGVIHDMRSRLQREAQVATAQSEGLSGFWDATLANADLWEVGDQAALMRILDRVASGFPERGLSPLVEARIRNNLGRAYRQMGGNYSTVEASEKAVQQFRLALSLFQAQLGGEHAETLLAAGDLAWALADLSFCEGGITDQTPRLREEKRREALTLLDAAFRTAEARYGTGDSATVKLSLDLCALLGDIGQFDRAEPMARELVARFTQRLGPQDPQTLAARLELGKALIGVGQVDQGITVLRGCAEDHRRVVGAVAEATHKAVRAYGGALQDAGRYDEAIPPLRESLAIATQRVGADNPLRLSEAHQFAGLLRLAKKFEEARLDYEDVIARRERVLPANHGHTLRSRCMLIRTLLDLGLASEAEAQARALVADASAGLEPGHPDIGDFRAVWAMALCGTGSVTEAEDQFRLAFEEVKHATGEFEGFRKRVIDEAVVSLRAVGREEAAASFAALLGRV